MTTLDAEAVTDHANKTWEGIVPVLRDYLAIPNASLDFDPKWRERGFMAEAVDLIAGWCRDRPFGHDARCDGAAGAYPDDRDRNTASGRRSGR